MLTKLLNLTTCQANASMTIDNNKVFIYSCDYSRPEEKKKWDDCFAVHEELLKLLKQYFSETKTYSLERICLCPVISKGKLTVRPEFATISPEYWMRIYGRPPSSLVNPVEPFHQTKSAALSGAFGTTYIQPSSRKAVSPMDYLGSSTSSLTPAMHHSHPHTYRRHGASGHSLVRRKCVRDEKDICTRRLTRAATTTVSHCDRYYEMK